MIPATQLYRGTDRMTCVKPEYMQFLFDNDLVVKADQGGLIQGPSFEQGGISIVSRLADGSVFCSEVMTEGWQYLLTILSDQYDPVIRGNLMYDGPMEHHYFGPPFTPYTIPPDIRIITVTPRLINGQSITPVLFNSRDSQGHLTVNKIQTKRHLVELDKYHKDSLNQFGSN